MTDIDLKDWPKQLRSFIAFFIFVLTCGVTTGLIYVAVETEFSKIGTSEHYGGSKIEDEFDIPDKYPMEFRSLLVTTHVHVIIFAIIFFILGMLTYCSSRVPTRWKKFLMVEPLISTLTTFGSIWLIRYVHQDFAFVVMISGLLMYSSYFIMASYIFVEVVTGK